MKALWKRHAERIDALSLRERLFIFLAVLCGLAALADALWVSPLWNRYKTTREQLAREGGEVAALRAQVQQRLGPEDGRTHSGAIPGAVPGDGPGEAPDANRPPPLRTQVQQAGEQLAALRAEVATLSADAEAMQRLPEVLERLLRRREGLSLVRVATLPPEAAIPGGLRRRSVELAMAGRYGDLVEHLAALEQALPQLRWGPLRLVSLPGGEDGSAPRAELSVRVDLIGVAS